MLDHAGVPQFPVARGGGRRVCAARRASPATSACCSRCRARSSDQRAPDLERARALVERARSDGRTTLSLAEFKALLAAFHVPVTPCERARSADEACSAAERIGLPVALKIDSPEITHKSDVGGVKVGLATLAAVRAAFEEMTRPAPPRCDRTRTSRASRSNAMHGKPFGRELLAGHRARPGFRSGDQLRRRRHAGRADRGSARRAAAAQSPRSRAT